MITLMRSMLCLAFALACLWAGVARAGTPARHCARDGTDDAVRAIPASLALAAAAALRLHGMPEPQIERSTVYRCAEGRILVCNYGANLTCGKADTDRRLPSAAAWCSSHPNESFIPAYVTGHATAFMWRCTGGAAVPGAAVPRDRRGFFARQWATLP